MNMGMGIVSGLGMVGRMYKQRHKYGHGYVTGMGMGLAWRSSSTTFSLELWSLGLGSYCP